MPRELPILFSGPMVRAILAGRKTVTRRLRCRFRPGDRLWVRETWRAGKEWDDDRPVEIEPYADIRYEADGVARFMVNRDKAEFLLSDFDADVWGKTRVSIHMPRWAARLDDMEVLSVTESRLQSITLAELEEEGASYPVHPETGGALVAMTGHCPPSDYLRNIRYTEGERWSHEELLRAHFASLWDNLNGAGSWKSNPLVYRTEFPRRAAA